MAFVVWLKYVLVPLALIAESYICQAAISVPTRDFSLRVPQAKPTQPETYVSLG